MTAPKKKQAEVQPKLNNKVALTETNLFLIITISVFFVMYVSAVVFLGGRFTKVQYFLDILNVYASLITLTCGMSLVMITGGIDISVGQVTSLVCMTCAVYLENKGGNVFVAFLIAIGIGLAFGLIQGLLVAYLNIQPFIITLAGLFFAKGLTTIICSDPLAIETNKAFLTLKGTHIKFGNNYIEIGVVVALATVIILFSVLRWTKLGRNFYAVGGNNQSANMLGINVKLTKFMAHLICGFCAGLGGWLLLMNLGSGNPANGEGAEMNAIASSIIGGTMLSGGVGNIIGSLFGVLSLATIKGIVPKLTGTSDDPWWPNITVSGMLCLFLILQSIIIARKNRKKA